MRKSLLLLAVASSFALAPAAFAAERNDRQPATVEARIVAPTPQTADRASLAQAHGAATTADQAKTAGRIPGPVVLIGTAVIIAVVVVASN